MKAKPRFDSCARVVLVRRVRYMAAHGIRHLYREWDLVADIVVWVKVCKLANFRLVLHKPQHTVVKDV
jgi:hypothetical protein